MSDPGFVHLHVHSSYSLLEGALTIARLAELAKADRQPALALTDTDNMFGALEFSDKLAGAGIQPIIGCCARGRFRRPGSAAPSGAMRSSCRGSCCSPRDEDGYRNLMRLTSRAFLDTPSGEPPHVKLAALERRARRADRAHRRPGRAARSRARGRTDRACGGALRAACRAVRRPALCRAAAPRACRRRSRSSRRCSISPISNGICRSSPPTSRSTRGARTSRRTTR